MRVQQAFICRDTGIDPACDWEARDTDEQELLTSACVHLQRRHAAACDARQLRSLLRAAVRGVGGI
ncbi:MAG TPA: DUF1059 domain-containing protein [Dehalococcoidia bacterium]|nr:DUF1059 domain-containing protein [Dehalococcoidia bacterium]